MTAATLVAGRAEPKLTAVRHFAAELALWRRLDLRTAPAPQAAHLLAAAHATASMIALRPAVEADMLRRAAPPWLARLMEAAVASTPPADLNESLADCAAFLYGLADPVSAWRAYASLRPLALPAAALLLRDGDSRLDLDPGTGCNGYGCSAMPRRDLVEFSSSTAADVSALALGAAESLRRELMGALAGGESGTGYAAAADRIKRDLLAALELAADGSVEPVLAASGTTAILLATHVALGAGPGPATAILIGPDETGRGVPLAARGLHPVGRTPAGTRVEAGTTVDGLPRDVAAEDIALRDAQGIPRAADAILAETAAAIERAHAAGRRPVLHALEGSKTGLVAPGIDCVEALRRQFPDLPIVVDACQLRTGLAVLARYLRAGCVVAVTGSKFFGGPPFSAALLLPVEIADKIAPLPDGLAAYSWRTDWPSAWDERCAVLPRQGNPGLLLRWRAALAEMDEYAELPARRVRSILEEFGRAVRAELMSATEFDLLPGPGGAAATADDGLAEPSIYTFAVRRADGRGWLTEPEMRRVYRLLNESIGDRLPAESGPEEHRLADRVCHIGQPLAFATGPCPAGLRIAAGARRIVAAAEAGGEAELRRDIADVIAKLRLILRRFPA